MAENDGLKLFGFEIKRAKSKQDEKLPSIVPPRDDEGGSYATASGTHYGQYLNMDGDDSKDNYQLIMKYRGNAMHPEVDSAIEDIIKRERRHPIATFPHAIANCLQRSVAPAA